jgi:hypothetical protein
MKRQAPFPFVAAFLVAFMPIATAWAHCDSLDGPVVRDARVALDNGDVTSVLKWVKQEDERVIRSAFEQAVAVRTKGDVAKSLADTYFFETLVRIHRAGEGEGFTGLQPAANVDPGIAAADDALKSGSDEELVTHLSHAIREGMDRRFKLALDRGKHAADSVDAGRAYVEAYVDYIHYVENVHRLVTHGVSHLHDDPNNPMP